jgi:hypothetical protein
MAHLPEFLRVQSALQKFVGAGKTQDQGHIKPMHKYVALRLVLEGGFRPNEITPRPPLKYEHANEGHLLTFDSTLESENERSVVGGVKTKNVDVVVTKDGIGPVIAVSVKGTGNAFRNLTNRMEELIGDCANLHMMYPGLVYGFIHLLKANRFGQPNLNANDICLDEAGRVVSSIRRWDQVLSELTGRAMLSDDGMRYEAIALVVAETVASHEGDIFNEFPLPESPLLIDSFFERLYRLYDLRYAYKLRNKSVIRLEWDEQSPALVDLITTLGPEWVNSVGYSPRLASH